MKPLRHLLAIAVAAACLAAAIQSRASGTYCACMPKPPSKSVKSDVDRDKYDLGQKVFKGRTAQVQTDAAAQRPRLQALQSQLPDRVAKKKDLTALAGKLTPEQLDALEYFVSQRYPKSE